MMIITTTTTTFWRYALVGLLRSDTFIPQNAKTEKIIKK